MKCQLVLPLLLLWTLSGSKEVNGKITVTTVPDGIQLKCEKGAYFFHTPDGQNHSSLEVNYKDENSGSYKCHAEKDPAQYEEIYVKFRTCDNCIELDTPTIAGLLIGVVLATFMVGIAVYLLASNSRPVTAVDKTSSDRQRNIVPNDRNSRAPNEHYQRLRFKTGGQKDEYDVINNRR